MYSGLVKHKVKLKKKYLRQGINYFDDKDTACKRINWANLFNDKLLVKKSAKQLM